MICERTVESAIQFAFAVASTVRPSISSANTHCSRGVKIKNGDSRVVGRPSVSGLGRDQTSLSVDGVSIKSLRSVWTSSSKATLDSRTAPVTDSRTAPVPAPTRSRSHPCSPFPLLITTLTPECAADLRTAIGPSSGRFPSKTKLRLQDAVASWRCSQVAGTTNRALKPCCIRGALMRIGTRLA